ncbi:hypothetical protein BOTCAL_0066g00290 [Botryotinia calthae]|uniref:Uncharacterized protein n=1 Tax=Botryotinia calthae TaxID=38488 RepID=A0A4Y8DBW6_9HELO|nr:hypothetical protein BOTCAL_0066g00290 [Botryotinia calthae]
MSKDNIQPGPAKSLGLGKAFMALSRSTSLTVASIKQKFKPDTATSDLPNEAKNKKQRKATLAKIQAKNKVAKKKSDRRKDYKKKAEWKKAEKRKSDKRKKKNKKTSMKKNNRTFNVPQHGSKAHIEKKTRLNKVKKVTTLSKDSYLNVKNFCKQKFSTFHCTKIF